MEEVLGLDLPFQSQAKPIAESTEVTNNISMAYDEEIQPSGKQDRPSYNNEQEEGQKTEETGMNNEELMEQSDDGESQVYIFTILENYT